MPGPRSAYGAAYDVDANRLFVHGGSTSSDPIPALWVLEHANGLGGTPAWRPLDCAGSAPARNGESGVFDRVTNSLLVFGGVDSVHQYHQDLWRVSGLAGDGRRCRWERIASNETQPSPRTGAAMMMDPSTQIVFLFGGSFQDAGYADVWTLLGIGK